MNDRSSVYCRTQSSIEPKQVLHTLELSFSAIRHIKEPL